MSIYKRGDKWSVDKVFPDGLIKKRIIGNKKQAREVERNWDKLIIEQKWHILFVREIRFKDFLKDYLKHIKNEQAESTYKINKWRIEKNILPYFRNIPIVKGDIL